MRMNKKMNKKQKEIKEKIIKDLAPENADEFSENMDAVFGAWKKNKDGSVSMKLSDAIKAIEKNKKKKK